MKVDKDHYDFRVWCESCSVRIAPHEPKSLADGKTYHERCYSKLGAQVSDAAAELSRTANTPGGRK